MDSGKARNIQTLTNQVNTCKCTQCTVDHVSGYNQESFMNVSLHTAVVNNGWTVALQVWTVSGQTWMGSGCGELRCVQSKQGSH